MRRLGKQDWSLIGEALDVLLVDYPDGHPEQARLFELIEIAGRRATRQRRLNAQDVNERIRDAVLKKRKIPTA